MGDFNRSPSKVWWPGEYNWIRRVSASPGSQDSGFSDTETSPHALQRLLEQNGEAGKYRDHITQDSPKKILQISENKSIHFQNLSTNYKQKSSPNKSIALQFSGNQDNSNLVNCNVSNSHFIPVTPVRQSTHMKAASEPIKKHIFRRFGSLKVSRNLFRNSTKYTAERKSEDYQYAKEASDVTESQYSNTGNSKVKHDDSHLQKSECSRVKLPVEAKSPLLDNNNYYLFNKNHSAPAILPTTFTIDKKIPISEDEALQSSDCESEIELAFHGLYNLPKYTSTPKTTQNARKMRYHKNKRNTRWKSHTNEGTTHLNLNNEPASVQIWLQEVNKLYDPECMTTLQCKSISGELAQKVAALATRSTATLRKILSDSELIITQFDNIQQLKQHTGPLAQSLTRLVEEFIKKYATDNESDLLKTCEAIRSAHAEDCLKLVAKLNSSWKPVQNLIVLQAIKQLIHQLEDPHSEIQIRAVLTGLTSIALRNKEIIDVLVSCNAVHILCVLCEKCESSTVRSLVLRALSTVCNNNTAVRQFESLSGIQLIAETISEETRPEPERSEAAALLAQVTAPWIEDNHSIQGLQTHIKVIVKALTYFIKTTKCCQNLLLCTAALANLTEMEPQSINSILYYNSVRNVLNIVKFKSELVSIYLLEQIATVIANLSGRANARPLLTEEHAPAALLHFLHCKHGNAEIESRLQQKSVIALSRLSSDPEAAQQIVKCDGVKKLIRLCRERKERHNSDAVLIAALATLRKIAESCGSSVIDNIDVQELIEPKLLDSFLAYSTLNESYV